MLDSNSTPSLNSKELKNCSWLFAMPQLHAKFSCQNPNSHEEKKSTEEFCEFLLCLLTN